MSEPSPIDLHAPGVDTEALVRDIQDTVARKAAEGVYADARVARAERTNLIHLKDDDGFLSFYLTTLREAAFVDINDFEIRERRARFAPLLVRLKKSIWSLLKFYTFRMWSQQNTVNGLFVTGLESLHEQYATKIRRLEERIAALEKKTGGTP
jgi:hypothetical protein